MPAPTFFISIAIISTLKQCPGPDAWNWLLLILYSEESGIVVRVLRQTQESLATIQALFRVFLLVLGFLNTEHLVIVTV